MALPEDDPEATVIATLKLVGSGALVIAIVLALILLVLIFTSP
jgi:hypothetical protein